MCTHTHTYIHVYKHMHNTWYAHIYTYLLTCIHTHTHTHTHTQTGTITHFKKKQNLDFPDGTVDKNLTTKSEDTGSIPGQGRFHMDWSS